MPSVSILTYHAMLHEASQCQSAPYVFVYELLLAGKPMKHRRWAMDWAQSWLKRLEEE